MKYFTLDKDKQYILYGAGGGAQRITKILSRNEYNLVGYIDKRAKHLVNIEGKPVWTMEIIKDLNIDKNNVVIIITTKNVFEHQEIVLYLSEMGFINTIYKPNKILQGSSDQHVEKISKAHDAFLIELDLPSERDIPCTEQGINIDLVDKFLIDFNEEKEEVTAWMPIELIFNYKQFEDYYDLNMASFFPMIDLYSALLGNPKISIQEGLEGYVDYTSEWVKRSNLIMTPDFKESFISSRIKVFGEMQKLSDIDGDFFIRNAPSVDSENGIHFNLVSSGRNRVSFLIAKQNKYVPVKIKNETYQQWLNHNALSQVIEFMNENRVIKVFSPIPHPKLVNIPVIAVDYIRLFVTEVGSRITRELYKKSKYQDEELRLVDVGKRQIEKEKMSMLCAIHDDGTISRFLASMGYMTFRFNTEENEKKYILLLDKLLYAENQYINNDFTIAEAKEYYCCILDNQRTEEELVQLFECIYDRAYVLIYNQETINMESWREYGFDEVNFMFSTIWDSNYVSAIELIRNNN